MSALFEQGFFVRKPAWHKLGKVLQHFPGRKEAMRLAGHDYQVVASPVFDRIGTADQPEFREIPDFKQLVIKADPAPFGEERNPLHGNRIGVVQKSYTEIQNSVPWDMIEALVNTPNVNYETGATLDGGRQCFVTAWLDEPLEIRDDDSPIYPYIAANWRHDGLGAFRIIRTSIREVCANTVHMAEAQSDQTGMSYSFRHTKNVHSKIEEVKMILKGLGGAQSAFQALADELTKITLTDVQREFFVSQFIPSPAETLISKRVQGNIDKARGTVRGLFNGVTIPDAHRNTGWGMYLAGTEYLDHLRGYRNDGTYVGRTLLRREPLKDNLLPLIREAATV